MDRQRPALRPTDGQNRTYSLRLTGLDRCPSKGVETDAPAQATFTSDAVPAGTASGSADPTNPMRIDSFAAIAASLDPEARAVFAEAVATLRSLKVGREQVEYKLKELGREDAIRVVTGVSALDSAIERTEAMIRTLGDMRRLSDEAARI